MTTLLMIRNGAAEPRIRALQEPSFLLGEVRIHKTSRRLGNGSNDSGGATKSMVSIFPPLPPRSDPRQSLL